MFFKKEIWRIFPIFKSILNSKSAVHKGGLRNLLCALLLLAAAPSVIAETESEELAAIIAQIKDMQGNQNTAELSAPGTLSSNNAPNNTQAFDISTPSNIIGGTDAAIEEYPEFTLVIGTDGAGTVTFYCGGTLISNNTVLTAAHCSTNPANSYFAIPGFHTFADELFAVPVDGVAIHPEYNAETANNDVAIMTLSRSLALPAASVYAGDSDLVGVSGTVIGIGFNGSTPESEMAQVLQEVAAPITSNALCSESWLNLAGFDPITESMLCAGFTTDARGTCTNDSGGPLLADLNGVRAVVGTVSFALIPCEANRATQGYARTSVLSDFILRESPNTRFITDSNFEFIPSIMMLLKESSLE